MTDSHLGWDPANHYKKPGVAEDYDRDRFTSLAGRTFNKLEKSLISKAFSGVPAGSSVGDIPCGTGRLAEVLLESNFRVTGVDIAAPMLATAKKRLERFGDKFQTLVADARSLSQAGIKFDAVLCARVLMHFPLQNQVEFLSGVAATTDGIVVFTQGLNTAYHRTRRRVKQALGSHRPAVYPITLAELNKLVHDAGLREVYRFHIWPGVSESVVVVTMKA